MNRIALHSTAHTASGLGNMTLTLILFVGAECCVTLCVAGAFVSPDQTAGDAVGREKKKSHEPEGDLR